MSHRHGIFMPCLLGALAVTTAMPAAALNLSEAYAAALDYDADLLTAKAARDETQAGVPVAWSAMLPQLSYTAQKNKANTRVEYKDERVPEKDYGNYDSGSSAWNLRQPLFRKAAWDALQVAEAQADAADANFAKEGQSTGLRAAASYLEVLSSRATASLAYNQTKTMAAWHALAEKAFSAGRGTRTDIEDAKARLDIAKAKEAEAEINLAVTARNFKVVTGLAAEKIPELNPLLLKPELLLVHNKEEWLERIENNNPEIQSLKMQLEAAQSGVAQMRSGHLPTLDIVATHRKSDSDYDTSIGQEYTTKYVGLQLNIPILNGGGVLAQTSQAQARQERIRQSLESTRRKALAEGDKLYQTIWQGSKLVQALNQAVLSAEQAVHGEKKGVQAGTRNVVDALDAERRMYESMREHATAAYSLAYNRLKFFSLAGAINLDAVNTVSIWLSSAKGLLQNDLNAAGIGDITTIQKSSNSSRWQRSPVQPR